MKESFERLLKKATDTRNSRFEAHRRNINLQNLSTYSVAGISALTIISSLYLAVVPTDELKDFVGLIGAMASLFILIISLVDSSKEYSLKAYLFHKCALDLSPICIKLEKNINRENFNEKLFDEIENEYDIILNAYTLNHTEGDYLLYKLKYKEKFYPERNFVLIFFRKFYINTRIYFLYYFMILSIFISTLFLIYRMYHNIQAKYKNVTITINNK